MSATLDFVRRNAAAHHGLAFVATNWPDGSSMPSVVNAVCP